MYNRIAIFPPEQIIPLIKKGLPVELAGKRVRTGSTRLRTYTLGLKCAFCERVITHFALESQKAKENWHLNAYHVEPDNREVLFTSDHIIPRSRGGAEGLSNRQPSCAPCNSQKGDRLPHELISPRRLMAARRIPKDEMFKHIFWYHGDSKQTISLKKQLMQKVIYLLQVSSKVNFNPRKHDIRSVFHLVNNPSSDWGLSPQQIVELIHQVRDLSWSLDPTS